MSICISVSGVQTHPKAVTSTRVTHVAAVTIAALAVGYFFWYLAIASRYPADDAFIHMRIARNLVDAGVPYFNVAEPVSATSSPLWTILLAGVFAVAGPHLEAVVVVAALCTLGLYCALAVLIGRELGPVAGAAAAAAIVACAALSVAGQLMEIPLALLLWCLSLINLRGRSYLLAGLFAGLALCTRYELVLWLAFAAAVAGRHGIRRFALGAVGPAVGLLLFNIGYFGSLIPNTVTAKSLVYSLSFVTAVSQLGLGYSPVLLVLLGLAAILIALLARDAGHRSLAAVLAFGVALAALYVTRRVLMFPWYTPLYMLPLLTVCTLTLGVHGWHRRLIAGALLASIAVTPMVVAGGEASGLFTARHEALVAYMQGLRVQRYLQIGAELANRYPGASLFTTEVGGLGWAFPYRIIDGVGLVTPESLRYHPMAVPAERPDGTVGAIPPQAVHDTQPDLIVSMDLFSTALQREIATGALEGYRLEDSYPALAEPYDEAGMPRTLWGRIPVTEVFVRALLP